MEQGLIIVHFPGQKGDQFSHACSHDDALNFAFWCRVSSMEEVLIRCNLRHRHCRDSYVKSFSMASCIIRQHMQPDEGMLTGIAHECHLSAMPIFRFQPASKPFQGSWRPGSSTLKVDKRLHRSKEAFPASTGPTAACGKRLPETQGCM